MECHEFLWIWLVSGGNAGGFKEQLAAPTRKNVGSLNPSKEQRARLDLSSLGWFSSIPSNLSDFDGIWWISLIWEVSGENAVKPKEPCAALQERMLDLWILANSMEQGWIWAPWVDFHGFHWISSIFTEFHEFCWFGRFRGRMLSSLRNHVLPYKKECWILGS